MKEKILVSACLCGINCKYDGKNNIVPEIKKLYDDDMAVAVCPEELGGLTTPRTPSEIKYGRVIDKDGNDVSKNFIEGAKKAFEICKENGCKKAILKSKSPSCGYKKIYDGTFTHSLTDGNGIFADLLIKNGIIVETEDEYRKDKR